MRLWGLREGEECVQVQESEFGAREERGGRLVIMSCEGVVELFEEMVEFVLGHVGRSRGDYGEGEV